MRNKTLHVVTDIGGRMLAMPIVLKKNAGIVPMCLWLKRDIGDLGCVNVTKYRVKRISFFFVPLCQKSYF
jgi:hypothetical protein